MKKIEQAVDSIVTLVNIISGHYNQSEICFLETRDAELLLNILRKAAADRLRHQT